MSSDTSATREESTTCAPTTTEWWWYVAVGAAGALALILVLVLVFRKRSSCLPNQERLNEAFKMQMPGNVDLTFGPGTTRAQLLSDVQKAISRTPAVQALVKGATV